MSNLDSRNMSNTNKCLFSITTKLQFVESAAVWINFSIYVILQIFYLYDKENESV